MNNIRLHILALIMSFFVGISPVFADQHGQPESEHEHDATTSESPDAESSMGAMDEHMKMMNQMREKMMAASDHQNRKAMMPELEQMMEKGMSMMDNATERADFDVDEQLSPRIRMLEHRVDLMKSMMQMMMDRLLVDEEVD